MDSPGGNFTQKNGIPLFVSPSVDPNLVVGTQPGEDGGLFDSDSLFGLDIPLLRDLPTEQELLSCLGEVGMFPESHSTPSLPCFPHQHGDDPFLEICPDAYVSHTTPPHVPAPCHTSTRRTRKSLLQTKGASEHGRSRADGTPVFPQKLRINSESMKKSYRGVSRHRLTQRWEASLWLKGKQLYLGGFNYQEDAARAYDLAALACKGVKASTNFHASEYKSQLEEIQNFSEDEVVAYIRRRSTAFSRGRSKYRGVSGQVGRWEARIGSFRGRKNVSFGVFETEEEASQQYDRALVVEKGRSAKTNFPLQLYEREAFEYEKAQSLCRTEGERERMKESYTLPVGRTVTQEEKKRGIVITAEALKNNLFNNN